MSDLRVWSLKRRTAVYVLIYLATSICNYWPSAADLIFIFSEKVVVIEKDTNGMLIYILLLLVYLCGLMIELVLIAQVSVQVRIYQCGL